MGRGRCGGCGGGGCGGCGWGWGGGYPLGYPGLGYGAAAVAAPPVMTTMPMQTAMAPYQASPMMSSGQMAYNQAILAPPVVAPFAALQSVSLVSPLGFRSKKVRSGKTKTVCVDTQTFFNPVGGIFIPQKVARHFEIKGLRVGNLCLINSDCNDGIPAELYSNQGCSGPAYIALPPIVPGQNIYLTVKNISSRAHTFRAALQGLQSLI